MLHEVTNSSEYLSLVDNWHNKKINNEDKISFSIKANEKLFGQIIEFLGINFDDIVNSIAEIKLENCPYEVKSLVVERVILPDNQELTVEQLISLMCKKRFLKLEKDNVLSFFKSQYPDSFDQIKYITQSYGPALNLIGNILDSESNNLLELSLINCGLKDNHALVIAPYLESKTIKIKRLNLSSNGFSALGIRTIMESLRDSLTLQELNLSNINLGKEGINEILNFILVLKMLKKLDLSNTNLDYGAASILIELIARFPQLEVLKLSYKELGIKGIEYISKFCNAKAKIKYQDSKFITYLATVMRDSNIREVLLPSVIQQMDLDEIKIGMELIKRNINLNRITLSEDLVLDEEKAGLLLEMIESNKGIKQMKFESTNFEDITKFWRFSIYFKKETQIDRISSEELSYKEEEYEIGNGCSIM